MRVYRLIVAYPPGSRQAGWEPPGWRDGLAVEVGYASEDDEYSPGLCPEFRWPARRHYLSGPAAAKRKRLLERFGAAVIIQPSDPVAWPKEVNQ